MARTDGGDGATAGSTRPAGRSAGGGPRSVGHRHVLVLPDGTSLDRRSLSKVRRGERGHGYVERRLAGFGVPVRRRGESGAAYLARALLRPGWSLRHGGCYRYAFRLGRTRAERAAVRIALPAGPTPKAVDDTGWREATPLAAPTVPGCETPTLL